MSVTVGVLGISGAMPIFSNGVNSVLIMTDFHRGDVSLHFPTIEGAVAVADAINRAVAK